MNQSLLSTEYSVQSWRMDKEQTIVTAVKPSMSQTDPSGQSPRISPLQFISRDPLFGLLSESQLMTTE